MSLTARGRLARPGLTLIEVMFAMSLMAMALLGVAGMFPAALRSVIAGGHTSKATMLAREMVDMIRGDSFGDMVSRYNGLNTSALGVACPVAPPMTPDSDYNKKKWACDILATGGQASGQGLPSGYGTVTVSCVSADGSAAPCSIDTNLLRVAVTVAWGAAGSRSVSLVTYVSKAQ